jgi:hypothetical protein
MVMKKVLLLISFSFVFISASGQFSENWSKLFQTTSTSNYSSEGRKVVSDANSNVFVLGDFSSDNDSAGHHVSTTQYSVRIRKYDFNGNLLTWAYIPVGGLITTGYTNRSGFGLELDASGNVYVGYSVLNAQGNYDVVIARYTNGLVKDWAQTYSTSADEAGIDLKLSGTTAIALIKSTSGANVTYRLVKTDFGGTIASLVYSFAANVDVGNCLAVNASKQYYVAGYSMVSAVKVAMIASVSSLGTLKWKSTFNHSSVTGDDYNSKLILGNDGNIYTIGTTYSSAANGNDAMVLKYNTSGILLGNLFLHNSASDVGGAIANGPVNFIFAACSNTNSMKVYKIQTNGALNATLSAFYGPTPTNSYTSITNVSVSDMKVAASNNVYVCGTVTGTTAAGNFSSALLGKFGLSGFTLKLLNSQPFLADFGDNFSAVNMGLDGYKNDILVLSNQWGNNTNHATENYKIIDYDGGASLRLTQEGSPLISNIAEVSLFPNPASDMITVVAAQEISYIDITDLTGKLVYSGAVHAGEAEISVVDLNKGLYLCKITTTAGNITMKRLMIN